MVISKRSWHFALAALHTRSLLFLEEGDPLNFCDYLRMVIFGGVFALFLIGISLVALCLGGYAIYEFLFNLYLFFCIHDYVLNHYNAVGVILLVFSVSVTLVGLVIVSLKKIGLLMRRRRPLIPTSKPGFFSACYRRWKEKACFKVEIGEDV